MSNLDETTRFILILLLGVAFVILWRLFIEGARQGPAPLRERAADGYDLDAHGTGFLLAANNRVSSSFMRGIKLIVKKNGQAHHGGHSSPNHDVV